MAWLGAGRDQDMRSIVSNLHSLRTAGNEVVGWIPGTAMPLVEGFTAFWRKDYTTAAEQLYGARHIANSFGGSHAQRDIIDLTLIEAAIRGGFDNLAETLAHERVALNSRSGINRRLLSRCKSEGRLNSKVAA